MSKGSERQFQQLLDFIESEMDFESGFYNDAYLDRRITARMRRTDSDTYDEYVKLLEHDEDEEREARWTRCRSTSPASFATPRLGRVCGRCCAT